MMGIWTEVPAQARQIGVKAMEIAQRRRWVKLRWHLAKSQSYLFSKDLEERFEAKIKMVVLVLDLGL